VEVVVLMFLHITKMSDLFLEQCPDMCSNLSSQVTTFRQQLSLEMKQRAFSVIPEANDKVCNGNS
jgi:hypothetical protein